MRKKRIMIIGGIGCGKTTLASHLEAEPFPVRKMPNMVYRPYTLEAPGTYLESTWMRQHLIIAAQDASCVLMLADASVLRNIYPPGFANAFRVPVIGVVTRCRTSSEKGIREAGKQLERAGIRGPFFYLELDPDCCDTVNLEALKQYLEPYRKLAVISKNS